MEDQASTQKARKPLTDEEMMGLYDKCSLNEKLMTKTFTGLSSVMKSKLPNDQKKDTIVALFEMHRRGVEAAAMELLQKTVDELQIPAEIAIAIMGMRAVDKFEKAEERIRLLMMPFIEEVKERVAAHEKEQSSG